MTTAKQQPGEGSTSNLPEPDVVICAWRTNDSKHDMSPQELLAFCRAVIRHSPTWEEGEAEQHP